MGCNRRLCIGESQTAPLGKPAYVAKCHQLVTDHNIGVFQAPHRFDKRHHYSENVLCLDNVFFFNIYIV